MKKVILPLIGLLSVSSALLAADALVIIDTKFEMPLVDRQTPPGSEAELPMKQPSRFGAIPPSSVSLGTETIGVLKSPYALFKDEGREGNPEASGNVNMDWSLKELSMDSGQFELTYRVTPLEPTIFGGRVQVALSGDDGKPIEIHIGEQPLYVMFQGDKIIGNSGRGNSKQSFSVGQEYVIKINFDLDAKSWSASVNDTPLVEEMPFSTKVTDAYPTLRIGSVGVGSSGGYGDKPNTSWAVSELKLVRLK